MTLSQEIGQSVAASAGHAFPTLGTLKMVRDGRVECFAISGTVFTDGLLSGLFIMDREGMPLGAVAWDNLWGNLRGPR